MYQMEDFRQMNRPEQIAVTKHAKERLVERGIKVDDVIHCINTGAINMLCMECGAKAEKGLTTDVTDLGSCLIIVRNVPCYKCIECNEVIYTADVVKQLENIIEQAKKVMQEISIVDYSKVA